MSYPYSYPGNSNSNDYLNSLIWGTSWDTSTNIGGSSGTITYSFNYGIFGFAWENYEKNAITAAIKCYENICSIDFINVDPTNPNDPHYLENISFIAADYDLMEYFMGDGSVLGFSDVPGEVSTLYKEGIVDTQFYALATILNFEGQGWSSAGLRQGGCGFTTLIHEFGHAMGLSHPHDDAGGSGIMPGVSSEFYDYGTNDLNQGIFTTMSYNSGWQTQFPDHSSLNYGYQGTPMAFDIAVMQMLYGANNNYNTGKNTYILPTANASGTYWSCIWDAGGADTISNAGSAKSCVINLNAAPLTGANAGGYVSWNSGIVGGFTIANGVVIENAVGGDASDTLTGNASDNILNGGTGTDTVKYTSAKAAVTVDLVKGNATSTAGKDAAKIGTDTLSGIESVIAGNYNDIIKGSNLSNVLVGGLGTDSLYGGADKVRDVFDFDNITETKIGTARDKVYNFISGVDGIDLKTIDANTKVSGDQKFKFDGTKAGAHSLWYAIKDVDGSNLTKDIVIYGDVNGDAKADFEIGLVSLNAIVAGDFIL